MFGPKTKEVTDALDKADLIAYFEKIGLTPKQAYIACRFMSLIYEVGEVLR